MEAKAAMDLMETTVACTVLPGDDGHLWSLRVDVVWNGVVFGFTDSEPYLYSYDEWLGFTRENCSIIVPRGGRGAHIRLDHEEDWIRVALVPSPDCEAQMSFKIPSGAVVGIWRKAIEVARAKGLKFA